MCGIIGIYKEDSGVLDLLLSSLERLEYRGYDSAGIATINESGEICCQKATGKIENLKKMLIPDLNSNIGIGHTRWATHGSPNMQNAHPIINSKLAIVHNGVVENHLALKKELIKEGYVFKSETDTEVILLTIDSYLNKNLDPDSACFESFKKIKGSFAVAAIFSGEKQLMISTRMFSPLIIGISDTSFVISSDVYAFPHGIKNYVDLDNEEMAISIGKKFTIFDGKKYFVKKVLKKIPQSSSDRFDMKGHRHFMIKEISEQPETIMDTIDHLYDKKLKQINLDKELYHLMMSAKRFIIIACGSSYFAGFIAKYWLESIIDTTINVELASEFCYANQIINKQDVFMFISQSGETADTLSALRKLKALNAENLIAIINKPESSLAKEAKYVIKIMIGHEFSVAATKSFTAQLVALQIFSLFLMQQKNISKYPDTKNLLSNLLCLPLYVKNLIYRPPYLAKVVRFLAKHNNIIFSGRNVFYGIALEGALKIKEVSYIHAEAIPAGELKHGSIALIEKNFPVVMINPYNKNFFHKTICNIQELLARGARIIGITDENGKSYMEEVCDYLVVLPNSPEEIMPIIFTVIVQLIAYEIAFLLGHDIDRPRNLAKSVTVE